MKAWLVTVLLALGAVRAHADEFMFAEATIDDLQARMAARTLTSRELTAAYLARIAALDHAGPELRAVIEVNPEALVDADRLDAERASGRVRGPLHGIPVLLKDNIATADRMETTAGSLALVGLRPPRDAHLVTRLRAAGAVLLGKTNLSEWANFRGEKSISGWSARGGQTRNPYALDRSPSGSSSGSAAAVAANLCVAAIGTETSGSITSPASVCGIVGLKPTVGLVSRDRVIPIAASFDTAGPMTRTVRDAALVLAALAGVDSGDPATAAQPEGLAAALGRPVPRNALRGARLGVVRGAIYRPAMDDVLAAALTALRDAGAEIVEVTEFAAGGRGPVGEVMLFEMKAGLDAYLATLGRESPRRSLADLIRFNLAEAEREMPFFGQEHFLRAQAKGGLDDPAYRQALAECRRLSRTEGIDAALARHRLDALVTITAAPAGLIVPNPAGDPVFGARGPGGAGYAAAAAAGYPSLTVPAAHVSGLPVGLLFFAGAWQDARLLALAADFEERTRVRRPPGLAPTLAGR